jgi:hypothetical protein
MLADYGNDLDVDIIDLGFLKRAYNIFSPEQNLTGSYVIDLFDFSRFITYLVNN